jgi:hypothetical protein
MKRFIVGIACAALSLCCTVVILASEPADPSALGFIKGCTWGWVGYRGQYATHFAADSMKKLADTGAKWVCIAFAGSMKTFDTPEIQWSDANPKMVSDAEIRRAVDLARDNGMKVILKPVVDCRDSTWRAWIKFYRPVNEQEKAAGVTGEMDHWQVTPAMRPGEVKDLERWERWWNDYEKFILHYAAIAEETRAPVLCLGCEMNSTEEFEDRWRGLITEVRKVYHGLLTYDVNHDRDDKVTWWDAVDFISISAYYPIAPAAGQSLEEATQQTTPLTEIVAGLEPVKRHLAELSRKNHKPILFIETGVINARGFARYPWSHADEHKESPVDEDEQANFYQAMCQVFWNEPWCMGFTWWDWPARLPDKSWAPRQRGFSPYGKKAESVLRDWYAKQAREEH